MLVGFQINNPLGRYLRGTYDKLVRQTYLRNMYGWFTSCLFLHFKNFRLIVSTVYKDGNTYSNCTHINIHIAAVIVLQNCVTIMAYDSNAISQFRQNTITRWTRTIQWVVTWAPDHKFKFEKVRRRLAYINPYLSLRFWHIVLSCRLILRPLTVGR